jgi:YHS domain-containing protein
MKLKMFFTALLMASMFFATAQNTLTDDNAVAVAGYDVTSYFKGAPTKGKADFTAVYDGAIYRFATAENRDAFKKNPSQFAPQYGGYCAFAIGKMNQKVPVNPETYKIVDGKLMLFFNDLYEGKKLNTLELWNGDEKTLAPITNINWARIIAK